MTITAVTFNDTCGPTEAVATLQDGSTKSLFSYYRDELTINETDLVGLTVEQARALHHERDVAYLQS